MTTPTPHREPDRFPAVSWATGETYGLGTVCDYRADDPSRVWFTLSEGAITEPRFPRVDVLNMRTLSFVVTDGEEYVRRTSRPDQRVTDSLERSVRPTAEDALAHELRFEETEPDHEWTLVAEPVTDPAGESLLVHLTFDAADSYDVYVVGHPTPSSRAGHTRAKRIDRPSGVGYGLVATDTGGGDPVIRDDDGEPYHVAMALEARDGFDWAAVAEGGENGREPIVGDAAGTDLAEGVVSVGARVGQAVDALETTLALGFATAGNTERAHRVARESLERGFGAAHESYVDSWREYLAGLKYPECVADDDGRRLQYNYAAMVIKAVEDKTYAGAGLASPSVPWGTGVEAVDAQDYGYNFVWSRDLYQVMTAFDAMGDRESAIEATEYLFTTQLDDDGFLPQNTFLEGRTRWGGEQLDNIAYPLVMAHQLAVRHDYGLAGAAYDYEEIRSIAEYILHSGPDSEQERWEEEAGYAPSTIAAEIAGLVCAAWFAQRVGESEDAVRYLAIADDWARGVEEWCATTTGCGDHTTTPYYVRVTDDGRPDEASERTLANGGPTLDERAIIDAGFLELVRLGIKPWDDPVVRNSLAEVDATIRVETPNGPAWYRYNGDGYGEQTEENPDGLGAPWSLTHEGKGRLWPIFSGERGEYELLAAETDPAHEPEALLSMLTSVANSGRMLPEQLWDREDSSAFGWTFGEGTAAATPLAWTCAQYVRLAHSIDRGRPVETPKVVAEFFGTVNAGAEGPDHTLEVTLEDGHLSGRTDADRVLVQGPEGVRSLRPDDGQFETGLEPSDDSDRYRVVAITTGETVWDLETTTRSLTLE